MDALPQYDVADILPLVKLPTLIVQRRDFLPSSGIVANAVDIPGILASGISDARIALVEGESGAPHPSEQDTVNQAIDDFLSEDIALTAGDLASPHRKSPQPSGVRGASAPRRREEQQRDRWRLRP